MHVLLFERAQFVPEREPAGDDQSNENADQKEPAISRQHDQQNRYDNDRDDKTCRSLQAESKPAARFRLHEFILPSLKGSRRDSRRNIPECAFSKTDPRQPIDSTVAP
jgi:hypothetical protein